MGEKWAELDFWDAMLHDLRYERGTGGWWNQKEEDKDAGI